MKISKRTLIIIIAIAVAVVLAGAIILTIFLLQDGKGEDIQIDYPERELLVAQVGYDYNFPEWIVDSGNISVKDGTGNFISVVNNKVFLKDLGDYTVIYGTGENSKQVPLKVIDSERPMFKGLWEEYHHAQIFPVNITIGETVDLDDIFIPVDNSGGKISVTYNVYHNGVIKIIPDENNCFLVEEGYYSVDVYAVDESGNAVKMSQKLTCVE